MSAGVRNLLRRSMLSGGYGTCCNGSAARTPIFAAVVPAVPTENSAIRRKPAATAAASPGRSALRFHLRVVPRGKPVRLILQPGIAATHALPNRTDMCAGSNQCIDTSTDPSNCGACGQDCHSGVCSNGSCTCSSSADCPSLSGCQAACAAAAANTPVRRALTAQRLHLPGGLVLQRNTLLCGETCCPRGRCARTASAPAVRRYVSCGQSLLQRRNVCLVLLLD